MFTRNHKSVVIRIVLLAAFLAGTFAIQPAHAQTVNFGWAQSLGGTGYDHGSAIVLDDSGNAYVTGKVTNTLGNDSIFIGKWDGNGDSIWVKSIDGPSNEIGRDIAVDGNGNVYIVGFYFDTVDFDPGEGTNNLTSAGARDAFLGKFDSDGNLIWVKSIGGTSNDSGNAVTVDGSGNIYLTGYYFDTVDFDPGEGTSTLTSVGSADVFVSKFDGNGNFLWVKSVGGPSFEESLDLVVDSVGNIFITGGFSGTTDFDPGVGTANLTSLGYMNLFISKLDNSGNYAWAQRLGGTSGDRGWGIALDGNGNVYIVGDVLADVGFAKMLASKLDSNGNFIWTKMEDMSSVIVGITIDDDGYLYIAGSGGFIGKLDGNGNSIWTKKLEGASSSATGTDVALDDSGNLYLTGYFSDTVDFDPGTGTSNLTSVGDADVFVSKFTLTPQIYYVKSDAGGANDGSSWTDAYTELQSALTAASSGDEIWVAAGTYKPTAGTDRTVSFALKNGVAVYGGFAGTETLRTQRDFEVNVTVLSGDIGAVGSSDNSYHVVVSSNTGNSTVLDGFTITAGNASGEMLLYQRYGAGMYNNLSSPSLTNIIFSGNSAQFAGGGMYNLGKWEYGMGSNPILTNVTFSGNSALEGGGMRNEDGSNPVLTNVIFSNNTAVRSGGGIENFYHSNPTLTNVTFSSNTSSAGSGGGIMNWSNSSPTLVNVTFNANSATDEGGGIYNDNGSNPSLMNVTLSGNEAAQGGGMYNASGSNPSVTNSILYGNSGGAIYDVSGTRVVSYSIVQGGYSGTGNLNINPLLGPLQDNGGFTPTMALGAGSPAINAGTDTGCPTTDQRGVARPQGSRCDIGSYEYVDTTTPAVITFTATTSSTTFDIPITAFTASDDVAVTGYMITTTAAPPAAGASGWMGTAPTTYTVASDGAYTLYPWVKDAAGNVSAVYGSPASVTVNVPEWEVVGAPGFSAGVAYFTSLALDDNGTPYVAYADDTNEGKATVMKFNGTNWEAVGAPDFSAGSAGHTSLVLDDSGAPYVAYSDCANGCKVTVMKFNGMNWEGVGAPGFSAGKSYSDISLALDDSGTPYVAYQDYLDDGATYYSAKATVMKFNGTNWEAVGAPGFSAGDAFSVSLVLDGSTPYVAYTDSPNGMPSGEATVMKFNGTSWEAVGAPGFSAGEVSSTSLALDDSGTPYVAYKYTNDGKATVMKFNGTNWEAVGTPGFSDGDAYRTSLALDDSGMPYVAYFVYGAKATVMRFNGTNWEVVGAPGFSAGAINFISLALDGSTPYVAYRDVANGNKATVMKFELPDTTQPTVDMFTVPSTSASLDIPITDFTALDDVAVTGYLITTTSTQPLAGAEGWSDIAPTTYTVASNGTYTLYPWVKDVVGNVSPVFGMPITVLVDATIPTVTITRLVEAANPTDAASVNFTVTFSEPVSGVETEAPFSDFSLTTSEGIRDAAITAVSGDGTTYTVTVNTGIGSGNLYLSVVDDDSIQDAAGNLLGGVGTGTISGEFYSVEKQYAVPGKPTGLLPLTGTATSNPQPVFRWGSVTDAVEYEILFAGNSAFTQGAVSYFVTDPTFTPETPMTEGKYYWRVKAYNVLDESGVWSAVHALTIDTVVPAAPVLQSPVDGVAVRTVPTFRWKAVSGAVLYQFELDNDEDFSSPVVSLEQRTLSRKPAGSLRGTYYWHVRAKDAAGNWSEWSSVFTVTIVRSR